MPLKIFKSVRANRNNSLLEMVGAVAISKNPVSRTTLQRILGVRKSTNRYYAYSDIHKNTNFLEQKAFLRIIQIRRREEKLYDLTVKGALSSLFSPYVDESKGSMLLEAWRKRDWGPGYDQPFVNVKDVLELRKFVETLYLHGSSLEDASEDILKRGLRNPEEVLDFIQKGTVTVTKHIDETGKYDFSFAYLANSVRTIGPIRGQIGFIICPDVNAGGIIGDLVMHDPTVKTRIGAYLLTFLNGLVKDFKAEGQPKPYYYSSDTGTLILALTIPEKVRSLLSYPERIPEYVSQFFNAIIEAFLQGPGFVQGTPMFNFAALRYDPTTRDLLSLSELERKKYAENVLKQILKWNPA